ncbi:MAG: molybdopterin-dependent oxidoreductase, partial [Syntrophaceae bacterium]|nr:molybdopterin-dependent oxidoreductase [Syntrophaceae bacterium]
MSGTYSRAQLIEAKVPGEDTGIEIKKTFCAVCGYQCAIDAYVKDGRLIKVEGSEGNPVNQGTLCAKGAANRQWIYSPERLRTPLLRTGERGEGAFTPISWEDAMERIASRLLRYKEESGPESVVFFAGFPKVMRPFLKRLAHTFGSPNYCTESSTCYLGPNLAGLMNYGYMLGPMGGAEVKNTRCILNWATNPLYSSPPSGVHFLNALERGVKLIDVGPLKTPLSERADIHLRIRPGTSGALALGMARVIIDEELYDREFVENWTLGFNEYRSYVQDFTPEVTAGITGVPKEKIVAAARLYATTKPATIVTSSNTTTHHTNGVQNHRAITALIGLTGNFDRQGGNHPVPTTYYARATGLRNREHEFEQTNEWEEMAPRVGQEQYPIWCKMYPQAQAMAVPEQILTGKPYPLRAILGFGLNHRMWGGSGKMAEALGKIDFFVNVDLFLTDSCKLADIVLPACSTFERHELFISASRYAMWIEPVIPPVGQSREDIDIVIDLAKRITPEDNLIAQGHEAGMEWIFAPAEVKIDELKKHPGGTMLAGRPVTPYEQYRNAGFPTPSGKMEFTSLVLKEFGFDSLPTYREPGQSPVSTPEVAKVFPLILTTGARVPMYCHSRTFRVPWLRRFRPDPAADINPRDAKARGIEDNEWVLLATPRSAIRAR